LQTSTVSRFNPARMNGEPCIRDRQALAFATASLWSGSES